MKQTPGLDRVQANMGPGVISLSGFLGDDGRKLGDILIEDEAAVSRMGLTHRQIAERMQSFRDEGAKGLGVSRPVPPHFDVSADGVRGVLACPFEDGTTIPKVNVTVENKKLRETVAFTDVGIHLIGAHGFYGGRHSPFRCDPQDLARILEIERLTSDE